MWLEIQVVERDLTRRFFGALVVTRHAVPIQHFSVRLRPRPAPEAEGFGLRREA